MKTRVCAAIIRHREILMVRHVEGERTYWTLPGGAVEADESDEQAVMREVREETGLESRVLRFLWDEAMSGSYSICRCFLMTIDEDATIALGFDPEEAHLPQAERMLQDVAWHSLDSMKDDGQVSRVIATCGSDWI